MQIAVSKEMQKDGEVFEATNVLNWFWCYEPLFKYTDSCFTEVILSFFFFRDPVAVLSRSM